MDQYRRISITTGRSGKDFNDSYVGVETSAIDAVLDRLPPAQIVKQEENGAVIEAEVYGKGIMMWLLSQGNAIEILKPAALREEMKEKLQEMLKKYE